MPQSTLPLPIDNTSTDAEFPPIRIGVSGTRDLPDEMWPQVAAILRQTTRCYRPEMIEVIHGGCYGVDSAFAHAALDLGHRIRAVLPPDRRMVDPRAIAISHIVEEIAAGPDGYRRRDQRVVNVSDQMIFVPLFPESHPNSRRSGTWMTYRMAKRNPSLWSVDVYDLFDRGR